jgi:hypothetical protein
MNEEGKHGPLALVVSSYESSTVLGVKKSGSSNMLLVRLRAALTVSKVAVLRSPFSVEQVAVLTARCITPDKPRTTCQKIHSII